MNIPVCKPLQFYMCIFVFHSEIQNYRIRWCVLLETLGIYSKLAFMKDLVNLQSHQEHAKAQVARVLCMFLKNVLYNFIFKGLVLVKSFKYSLRKGQLSSHKLPGEE